MVAEIVFPIVFSIGTVAVIYLSTAAEKRLAKRQTK